MPRLLKHYNLTSQYKTVEEILRVKANGSRTEKASLPQAPADRTIPFFHHEKPEYTWTDATEVLAPGRSTFLEMEALVYGLIKDSVHKTVLEATRYVTFLLHLSCSQYKCELIAFCFGGNRCLASVTALRTLRFLHFSA